MHRFDFDDGYSLSRLGYYCLILVGHPDAGGPKVRTFRSLDDLARQLYRLTQRLEYMGVPMQAWSPNRRPLSIDEVRHVVGMARRLAAVRLLEPALDTNYAAAVENSYPWPVASA